MRASGLVWCLTLVLGWAGPAISQALRTGSISIPDLSAMAREVEDAAKMPPIGPGAHGPAVVRAQILLDRARFSPGQIDGSYGDDLAVAIRGYREAHGLTAGAAIDGKMWSLLDRDRCPVLETYTITAADLKGPFTPIPKDVKEQATMKWMGYESPEEELGEKFLSLRNCWRS